MSEEKTTKEIITELITNFNKTLNTKPKKPYYYYEDDLIWNCPSDCQGCMCPNGHPPCFHCVEHSCVEDF